MSSLKQPKMSKLAKVKADPNSKYWREKADVLWADLVRRRDGGCVVCGETAKINAHHLIDRSVHYLRHTVINGVSLCVKHHKYSHALSAHGGPVGFASWMMLHRQGQWANVTLMAQQHILHEANNTMPAFSYQQDYHQLVQYRDSTYPATICLPR